MSALIGTAVSVVVLGVLSIGYLTIVLVTLLSLIAAPLGSVLVSLGAKRKAHRARETVWRASPHQDELVA